MTNRCKLEQLSKEPIGWTDMKSRLDLKNICKQLNLSFALPKMLDLHSILEKYEKKMKSIEIKNISEI